MPSPPWFPTSISRPTRSAPPWRRPMALVLCATLSLASVFPGFAFAGEPDSEGEGTSPPIELPIGPPDFDPGGEETGLEEEAPPSGAGEEGGPELEAEAELEVPAPPEATGVLEPEAPVEPPPPPPAPEPVAAPAPEPAPQEAERAAEPIANKTIAAPDEKIVVDHPSAGEATAAAETTGTEAPAAPAPEEAPAAPPPAVSADPGRSLVGKDTYVVRKGDCLWHIASRLLPVGADTDAVEDEVERLWRLNEERIGTGDPSLIYAGTELRLR